MLGVHRPSLLHLDVMLYRPLIRICPAGHETLTTVPGIRSVVLTTRENANGRQSIAANEQSLHQRHYSNLL